MGVLFGKWGLMAPRLYSVSVSSKSPSRIRDQDKGVLLGGTGESDSTMRGPSRQIEGLCMNNVNTLGEGGL